MATTGHGVVLISRPRLARPFSRKTGRPVVLRAEAARTALVTREKGKNSQLINALQPHGVECLELPLIEHRPGKDVGELPAVLQSVAFEWVTITSPQAAEVFLEAWALAGRPDVRVASVGKGTSRVLENGGVAPAFTPSVANAATLSKELPIPDSTNGGKVLYPASAKARSELQDGLASRGFEVTRLNTYDTVPVESVADDDLRGALKADVVTFGSPSAVKAWRRVAGERSGNDVAVACIGGTSAKAAEGAGFTNVYYPKKPGVEGWAESVLDALDATAS
ncbi:hypothetical protein BSKO_09979 [Bryopsis sp. KO-2023]|nr:hypothetical protein BSKO_09979 [Bryopsis sp. KO-2023]